MAAGTSLPAGQQHLRTPQVSGWIPQPRGIPRGEGVLPRRIRAGLKELGDGASIRLGEAAAVKVQERRDDPVRVPGEV